MNPGSRIDGILHDFALAKGPLLLLTGAGISAESGIPTFRGPEGFWTQGSTVYQPEEIATYSFFMSAPEVTWGWYLFRRAACRAALPNAAHEAAVQLESQLGRRFVLVTQNVDGLHRRAGTGIERLMEIHGNLDRFRCSEDCTTTTWPVPAAFDAWSRGRELQAEESALLRCAHCGAWGRPHVLWFDECYDETHFRFLSAQQAAIDASLIIVVGTTGATNLPIRIAEIAARRKTPFIDINIEDNIFRRHAEDDPNSLVLGGKATRWLPEIAARWPQSEGAGRSQGPFL